MKNSGFFLCMSDLKCICECLTVECSSNSYKSSVELLIALSLSCTNIRIAFVGQKDLALSDVAFCPWQGHSSQLIQEGEEMLCILKNFCFVLTLV